MEKVKIDPAALEVMYNHAKSAFPNECCGFMYGEDGVVRSIDEAVIVDNSKEGDQRRRFEISPLDYMKAEQYALKTGKTLLGVYHSHPNHPAIPSIHDLKQAVPFFSYAIISVMNGEIEDITSSRLTDDGEFEYEELQDIKTLA